MTRRTCNDIRRLAGALGIALMMSTTAAWAAEVSGPEPQLAPAQDRRAAGSSVRSTVYREPDGTPYVLKGPNEKQFLSGYNVTWVDQDHVIGPPGFGGFD